MSNGNNDKNSNLGRIIGLIQSGVQKGYITSKQMSEFQAKMNSSDGNSNSGKVVFRFLDEEGDGLKREELFQNLIKVMNNSVSRENMQKQLQKIKGENLYEWMELLWNISGVVKK